MKMSLLAPLLAGVLLSGGAVAQTTTTPVTPPPPPAGSQPPPPPPSGMMMRADTDGDGAVSRQEFLAQAAERFGRMDQNGDGRLTADEIGARGRGARAGGPRTPPPPAPPARPQQ